MKITGFRPVVVTKDADALIKLFEDLGFEKKHTKTDIEGGRNTSYYMKDANGNSINIASSERTSPDLTSIYINVDNFQEAYEFFIGHGFTDPRGEKTTVTSSNQATLLVAPSGFTVTISEHFRERD